MIWPDILSHNYLFITVLENTASWLHLLGGLVVALLGCPGRYLAAYALYQPYTTTAKTLLFPGHGLADWSWDFIGDNVEFLAGIGLGAATAPGRMAGSPAARGYCEWRTVGLLLGLLTFRSPPTVFFGLRRRFLTVSPSPLPTGGRGSREPGVTSIFINIPYL